MGAIIDDAKQAGNHFLSVARLAHGVPKWNDPMKGRASQGMMR
jgi:hypothetical protein